LTAIQRLLHPQPLEQIGWAFHLGQRLPDQLAVSTHPDQAGSVITQSPFQGMRAIFMADVITTAG